MRRLAFEIVARKGQRRGDHPVHLLHAGNKAVFAIASGHFFRVEEQAGQTGPEIVRQGGKHVRPLIDKALDALLHFVHGSRDDLELMQAGWIDRDGLACPPEFASAFGKPLQRAQGLSCRHGRKK